MMSDLLSGKTLEGLLQAETGLFPHDHVNMALLRRIIGSFDNIQGLEAILFERVRERIKDPKVLAICAGSFQDIEELLETNGLDKLLVMASLKACTTTPEMFIRVLTGLAETQLELYRNASLAQRLILCLLAGRFEIYEEIGWEATVLAATKYPLTRRMAEALAQMKNNRIQGHGWEHREDDLAWDILHYGLLSDVESEERILRSVRMKGGEDWSVPFSLGLMLGITSTRMAFVRNQLCSQLYSLGHWHLIAALKIHQLPLYSLILDDRSPSQILERKLQIVKVHLGESIWESIQGDLALFRGDWRGQATCLIKAGQFRFAQYALHDHLVEAILGGVVSLTEILEILADIPQEALFGLCQTVVHVAEGRIVPRETFKQLMPRTLREEAALVQLVSKYLLQTHQLPPTDQQILSYLNDQTMKL